MEPTIGPIRNHIIAVCADIEANEYPQARPGGQQLRVDAGGFLKVKTWSGS
jgi:hypothetical protein